MAHVAKVTVREDRDHDLPLPLVLRAFCGQQARTEEDDQVAKQDERLSMF